MADRPADPPGHSPTNRPANRLATETSAYLRQHMHNPVDWHPWGEEALALARETDRPLLVSIGYSACHWCHVMEHESFEDPKTAAFMNERFVPIKVDREERPDVDQIYMETVVRLHGHGGWPLTVFCTPAGRPFYGGTYFPPEPRHGMPSFREVLAAVDRAWREQRPELDESARRIVQALQERPRGVASAPPGTELLATAAQRLLQSADRVHGGFGGAPKFPTPTNLELLLAAADLLPGPEAADALDFLGLTCAEMSRRGLYDQLGGGFHRYCVDDHWGIPHFEKMLYDQGPLLRVYADLWRRTQEADLRWPILETADWLRREMRADEGGYFASQDADSEGEEGRFYVWTPEQVEAVLGPERGKVFCAAYHVTEGGNFEGRSVLWDVARAPRPELAAEREALRERRAGRVPPSTDRKRVAAWNGLAISGLAYAGSVIGAPQLVSDAAAAADFVLERMVDEDGRPLRIFAEGRAKVPAFLDDVAAMLSAALDLQRAGAGERYLEAALRLADELVARFFDSDENDFFLAPQDGERLVQRPRSDQDGATPHSAGLAVLGCLRVAALSGREDLQQICERVLRTYAFPLERAPAAHPTLLRAVALARRGVSVAVVLGDPSAEATDALALRARRVLGPEDAVVVIAPGSAAPPGLDPSWLEGREPVQGRPTAFVCRGRSCSLPVTDPAGLTAFPAPDAPGA